MTASLSTHFHAEKSTPPVSMEMSGMMISLTSEVVILPNAPPMTTPTAISMHVAAHGKGLELFKKLLHGKHLFAENVRKTKTYRIKTE